MLDMALQSSMKLLSLICRLFKSGVGGALYILLDLLVSTLAEFDIVYTIENGNSNAKVSNAGP